jgi:acetyltransferase EpsM
MLSGKWINNMAELFQVLVPLVNPNENEALLAQLGVHEGQQVKKGEVIAVFETTKSTFELPAEKSGFIIGLTRHEGDLLKTGDRFCFIADRADQKISVELKTKSDDQHAKMGEIPSGLRITQPALALAREKGIALESLPTNQLVTEKTINAMNSLPSIDNDPAAIVIYGGGGHAKSLIELIRAEGKYHIIGILDDALLIGSLVLDLTVLGGGGMLGELKKKSISQAVNAVGGIGNITPRLQVYEKLKLAGFSIPNVIHPRAYIEPTAKIGNGGQFFYNAYIGSEVKVGFGCIVNTSAVVSHDCVLEDFVNISPGALLAGGVIVKERALIGMGVTVNLGVMIGAGSRVGNSAVVKADVPENGIVRAGSVWPPDRQ